MHHIYSLIFYTLFCTFYEAGAQTDFESNLPIIKITTSEEIPDEPKIRGTMEIIWNRDGTPGSSSAPGNEYTGQIGIERRGQTSLFFFQRMDLL